MSRAKWFRAYWVPAALIGAVFLTMPASGLSPEGPDFPVEEYLENETQPAVAYADGGFLVVHSYEFGPGDHDVWARFVTEEGLSEEILVDDSLHDSVSPDVACDSESGRFLVVWEDFPSGGGNSDIYGAILDGNGSLAVGSFAIGTTPAADVRPRVTYGGAGVFVVAWASTSDPATVPDGDIFATTVSSTGVLGTIRQVSTQAGSINPQIAASGGAYSLVAWQYPASMEGGVDDWNWNVSARTVDLSGSPAGAASTLADAELGEVNPCVAYSWAHDQFLVIWEEVQTSTDHDLKGVLVTSGPGGAIPAGGAITIEDSPYTAQTPSVSSGTSGDTFLVTWAFPYLGNPGDLDIAAKEITNDGSVGPVIIVSDAVEAQDQPAIGCGELVALTVWQDLRQGTDFDIYAQWLTGTGGGTVSVHPVSPQVAVGEWIHFRVIPGTLADWALTQEASGGSIDPGTGVYQSGDTGGVTDVVTASVAGQGDESTNVAVTWATRPSGTMGPPTSMDLDGGGVGISDVILLLRLSAGMDVPSAKQVEVGDFDIDGQIGISDTVNALRVVAGLPPLV